MVRPWQRVVEIRPDTGLWPDFHTDFCSLVGKFLPGVGPDFLLVPVFDAISVRSFRPIFRTGKRLPRDRRSPKMLGLLPSNFQPMLSRLHGNVFVWIPWQLR